MEKESFPWLYQLLALDRNVAGVSTVRAAACLASFP